MHDKEILDMKYALTKLRVYLLGDRPFIVYTDHASLRTAVNNLTSRNEDDVAVILRGVQLLRGI